MLTGKTRIITDDLDWTEGKIKKFFAKELISLTNGSVKLVKIDPEAAYPMHAHPDKTEYVYLIKGQLWCKIGIEEFHGNTGNFFIFPKGEKHSLVNCSEEECLALVGSIKS